MQQLRDKLAEVKTERNKLGDELHEAIQRAKANVFLLPLRMRNSKTTVLLSKVADRTLLKD